MATQFIPNKLFKRLNDAWLTFVCIVCNIMNATRLFLKLDAISYAIVDSLNLVSVGTDGSQLSEILVKHLNYIEIKWK